MRDLPLSQVSSFFLFVDSDDVQILTQHSNYAHQYINSVSNNDVTTSSKENNQSNSNKKPVAFKEDNEKANNVINKPSPALIPSNKPSSSTAVVNSIKGEGNQKTENNHFLFKQASHINTTAKVTINNDKAKNQNINILRNSTDLILTNLQNIQNLEMNLGNKMISNLGSNNKFTKASKPSDQKKCDLLGSKEKEKEVKISNQLNTNPYQQQPNLFFNNNNNSNITNNISKLPQEIQFNNISNSNYIANVNLNINSNNQNLLQLQNLARQQTTKIDQKKMFNDIDNNSDYMEEKLKNRVLNNKNQSQNNSNKSFNNSGSGNTNKKSKIKKRKSNSHISDYLSMEEALTGVVSGEKRSGSKCSSNNDNKNKLQRGATNVNVNVQMSQQRSDSKKSQKCVNEEKRDKSKDKEIDFVMNQLMRLEDKIMKTKGRTVISFHKNLLE